MISLTTPRCASLRWSRRTGPSTTWHWRYAGAVHEQIPASKPVSAGSAAESGASLRHEDYGGVVSRLVAVAIDVVVITVAAAAAAGLVVGGAEGGVGGTPGWAGAV